MMGVGGKAAVLARTAISTPSEERDRRRRASSAAGAVAIIVLLIALGLMIFNQVEEDDAEAKTEKSVTETITGGENAGKKVTESVEIKTPARDTSLAGRALGTGASPLLLQLMVAGIAAFVSAAIVQRVWLGEYGFTVGPVSLPALPAVSEEAAIEAVDLITESPEFAEILGPGPRRPVPFPQFDSIADPRLALISIRIELEERLRSLADAVGLDRDIDLKRLPDRLAREQVFDLGAARGLRQLLELGDRVVAGAEVDEKAEVKVREIATSLLYALGELERRARERS